jgi:hypothetical protein
VFTDTTSSVGVAAQTFSVNESLGQITGSVLGAAVALQHNGSIISNKGSVGTSFGVIASGAVICVALDCDARLIWFRVGAAGNWNNVAGNNPATGVGGVFNAGLGSGIPIYPGVSVCTTNDQITANFGNTAFTGAVPSGYTSGFTAGASVPTNALASQVAAEHWLTTNPAAQITQVAVEHWQSVTSDNLQAIVTQVAIEHWMSVASVSPAAGGPMVTMIP